jgi:trimeric autotransporter adhesin
LIKFRAKATPFKVNGDGSPNSRIIGSQYACSSFVFGLGCVIGTAQLLRDQAGKSRKQNRKGESMFRISVCLCVFLLLTCCVLPIAAQQRAAASANVAVPPMVNFSGVLTEVNGKPLTGVVGVTFNLYRDSQGGAPLWMETQNVQADKAGHYSAALGSSTSQGLPASLFASGEARWLGVQAQGQAEQPRVLLMSVPYAMKALDAETIGGRPVSSFMLAPPSSSSSGNGPAAPPGTITGSGTADFVPLFTGATTIGNSKIFQAVGGNIGIATTAPAAKLDVKGTGDVRDTLTLFPKLTHPTLSVKGTAFAVSSTGKVTFIAGQAFPGTGTVTSVGSGAGLTGGPITGSGTLSIPSGGVTNAMLAHSSLTVTANSPLSGGGSVSLGGTTSLGLKGCSNNQVLRYVSGAWTCANAASGTVTSVGLSAPSSDFTVSGSPVTTSGTLGLSWTVAPTSAATANAIVKRDANGSFSAGPISASTASSGIAAVAGTNTSTSESNMGVYGASTNGYGVQGGSMQGSGVVGTSTNGYGAVGTSTNYIGVQGTGGGYGVTGDGGPTGVYGNGSTYGVYGTSDNYGVYGSGSTGVYGASSNGTGSGVSGVSSSGPGVYAQSDTGWAVDAYGTSSATGVLAGSVSGYAAWFNGNVNVDGNLSKAGGSFKIDHPLDPANKYLYHSFVESPDMMNIYNGNVTSDAHGDAVIDLPEWFETLNRDFRYQLTVIGQFAQAIVSSEIANGRFSIKTDKPSVKVSWQVTGIRQDAWAKAHRIPVEAEKPEQERGFYLHPELYGAAEEKGVLWARSPQAMKQWKEARSKVAATDGKDAPAMTPLSPQQMRGPHRPMVTPPLARVSKLGVNQK